MTICNFFLQGRCRYGDKCWNEHPRGGRGGDYRGNQQQQQSSRGGFGNRVWINPSQRGGGGGGGGGGGFIQPSSFSGGRSNDWSRGGGASADVQSSDFSFSSQNRFTALSSHSSFDRGGQNTADDNARHLDTIQKDMEAWQTSGQWPFSCYSAVNGQISGFVELSPEELRLEYYTGRASGDIQSYVSSVQQLANQWSSRVQELRTMNSSTQMSVMAELNTSSSQPSSQGYGSSDSTFSCFGNASSSTTSGFGAAGFGSGSQSSGTFSFAPSKTDFGASNTQQASGFSNSAFSQPSSGFGSATPSAASFSFSAPESKPTPVGFGSAPDFSFRPSAAGLGTGFGSTAPVQSSGFGAAGGAAESGDSLFTPHSELTAEELKEFTAKRFTLGQIPLKPPPADLLMV